jgi:SAM-dependent methyltransferase
MTSEVPQLFDPVKVGNAQARAERLGPEGFLVAHAAADLALRLATVRRDFTEILDVGTPMDGFRAAFPGFSGRWRRVGPDDLPDLPGAFDLALCGMLFHRINDLPGLMLRIRRLLRPDGLMLAVFPGGETLHELRDCLLRAESEVTGHAAMRVAPMIDVRAAGQLLQRAGFALPVTDGERVTLRYPSLMALVRDLRAMASSGTLMLRAAGTPALTRAVFLRAAELYAAHHADPDGRLRATIDLVWMSGWAPHESQQKPLKPGSAKARLADALAAIAQAERPPRSE